jgi:hypothetical protein
MDRGADRAASSPNRVVHPVFAIGGVVLVLFWPLRYAIGRSEAWQPIGQWFAEVGKHLLF